MTPEQMREAAVDKADKCLYRRGVDGSTRMTAIRIPLSWPMFARADYYGYRWGVAMLGWLVLIVPIGSEK